MSTAAHRLLSKLPNPKTAKTLSTPDSLISEAIKDRKQIAVGNHQCASIGCKEMDIDRGSGMCNLHTMECGKMGGAGLDAGTVCPELFPMYVLDFQAWQKMGQIYRYSAPELNDRDRRIVRVRYTEIDRKESFVILISHKWLDEVEAHEQKGWDAGKAVAHPDLVKHGHPKFELIVKAVRALQKGPLQDKKVFLWIDYSCLPNRQEGSYSSYVERCDALLTPLVEPPGEKDWWTDSGHSDNLFFDHGEYLSPAWQAYLSDAWCRLDYYLSTYAPTHPDCVNFFQLVDASSKRLPTRAHLIYGDCEVAQQRQYQRQQQQGGPNSDAPSVPILVPPVALPEVPNSFLSEMHPLLGLFNNEADRPKVQQLVTLIKYYRDEDLRHKRWLKMKGAGKKGKLMAMALGGFGAAMQQNQYTTARKEGSKSEAQLRRMLENRLLRESMGGGRAVDPLERRFLGVQAARDVANVQDGMPLHELEPSPMLTPKTAMKKGAADYAACLARFGKSIGASEVPDVKTVWDD
jgi:hypothetical protein